MSTFRIERLQELIRLKVATMLLRDVNDPRLGLITITRVRLSGDVEFCTVYWSTLEEGGARTRIAQALDSARGFIQREVAKHLQTRKAPHLEFEFDPSVERAFRVDELIRRATEEDAARAKDRAPAPDAASAPDSPAAPDAAAAPAPPA